MRTLTGIARRFPGRLIDMPTILIAVGWAGLWFVWPSVERRLEVPEMPRMPDVRFMPAGMALHSEHNDPTVIAFHPLDGALDAALARGSIAHVAPNVRDPRYLDPRVKGLSAWECREAAAAAQNQSPSASLTGDVLRLNLPGPAVFAPPGVGPLRVVVSPARTLRDRGFSAPDLVAEAAEWSDRPWQVVGEVDMDEQGEVKDVFLESGSTQPAIDASVVRLLYRARLAGPGERCSGRVTVSYGP